MDMLFLDQAKRTLEGKYFVKTRLNLLELLEYSGTIRSVIDWRAKDYMVTVKANKDATRIRNYFYSEDDVAFLLAHKVCNESNERMIYIYIQC